ncbi:dephospho-CoA kinase [Companilactobacillus huachuanensis]|uniref:Dephospho-CoA kinase n=1 Tax=Companilactobacillus huachuanensis TaxID=2559914 RepID=A0ABW1RIH3_9LACO|nr:dephospho-CoA kinase [Companilactobacillus huachuanensis]
MSKIYGLTGGIAAGKSTVLAMFREHGFIIFDADSFAREVVIPNSIGLKQIVDQFGEQILNADGTLNRAKLGSIVFSDNEQLQKLNHITRPLIKEKILETIDLIKKSTSKTIAIFEIQLLFEGGYENYFDGVISLYERPEIQLDRLMKRNDLSKKVAQDRINSQLSMDEKKRRADFVIDNSGDLKHLEQEFEKLMSQL